MKGLVLLRDPIHEQVGRSDEVLVRLHWSKNLMRALIPTQINAINSHPIQNHVAFQVTV